MVGAVSNTDVIRTQLRQKRAFSLAQKADDFVPRWDENCQKRDSSEVLELKEAEKTS